MTDESTRYRPFDRCGYTVVYCHPAFKDDPPLVRIARGHWGAYLPVSLYDQFEGDDIAFTSVMDARREDTERQREQTKEGDDT